MSVAVLIFLTAAAIGLQLFQFGAASLQTAYVFGEAQDRSIVSTLKPIAGDGTVSGAEVLQTLAQIPETGMEVEVNGQVYSSTLEREQLNANGLILSGRYLSVMERDAEGQVVRVRFTFEGGGT
nr:hypothetical protein [Cohnella zeiphila]